MISPQDLKYFMEVAQVQHLSRAAERLGMTQPALTHSLKKVEQELGHALFLRTKKGMTLTPAGAKLLEKSKQLLLLWDDTMRSVDAVVTEASGTLRLGVHSAVSQYTLPVFLPQLLKDFPQLELQLSHGLSRHMTEMVVSSQLDVAIAVNPMPHPDLIMKELARDEVSVWASKNCLNPDLLMLEPHLIQSQAILKKLAKKGLRYQRILESESLEVIAQLLVAGNGHAILPERVLRSFAGEKSFMKIKDAPTFDDKIFVVFKQEFRKQKRGEVFLKRLFEAFIE